MVQVYTEGLFVGMAFSCLAMLKRKQWVYAALFAVATTLTCALGVVMIIPMAVTWIRTGDWIDLDLEWRQIILQGIRWRPLRNGLLAFAPLIVFAIWKFSYYGQAFDFVEANFFGQSLLWISEMHISSGHRLFVPCPWIFPNVRQIISL